MGHEVIESVTALTGGNNDAAQEDQATAFGGHFADRVDQAFEGGINTTSTGSFTTSLVNSNAVQAGTTVANAASGASFDNRRLNFSESQVLQNGRERIANNLNLTEEQKQQEITRLNALACAEVHCARGVSSGDPLYDDLKALEDLGNQLGEVGYSLDGMLGEEAVAGQFSTGVGDWFDDQLTSFGESLTRAGGVVQAAGGSAGAVGGGALATAGGVGCGPTAGTSCLLVPAGGALMYIGVDEAQEGWQTAVGPFTHTEGQAVFDTLDPETHPGNNNPTLEAASDAGMFILEIAAGKVGGKYLDDVLDASPGMTPVPLRVADDVPSSVIRKDDDFSATTNAKNQKKSHIDDNGNLVPANPDGDITIQQHVRGSDPAKSNSQYTSTTAVDDNATANVKNYGENTIEIDTKHLQEDIDAGKIKGVEIIPPKKVQDELKVKVEDVQEIYDANPTKNNARRLKDAKKDLENSIRDNECLIKGCVPSDYINKEGS